MQKLFLRRIDLQGDAENYFNSFTPHLLSLVDIGPGGEANIRVARVSSASTLYLSFSNSCKVANPV